RAVPCSRRSTPRAAIRRDTPPRIAARGCARKTAGRARTGSRRRRPMWRCASCARKSTLPVMPFIESTSAQSIITITLNRPEKLNAFAGTMREELIAALHAAAADSTCRVVVITGAGRGFCAGGDVEYMSSLQRNGDVAAFRKLLDAGREVVMSIAA